MSSLAECQAGIFQQLMAKAVYGSIGWKFSETVKWEIEAGFYFSHVRVEHKRINMLDHLPLYPNYSVIPLFHT